MGKMYGTFEVPPGKYYPCVLMCWKDTLMSVTYRGGSPECMSKLDIGGMLYQNKQFSDAVIQCSEQKFFVHRAVLAIRSPVFSSMLDSGMRETKEATVEIHDSTPG